MFLVPREGPLPLSEAYSAVTTSARGMSFWSSIPGIQAGAICSLLLHSMLAGTAHEDGNPYFGARSTAAQIAWSSTEALPAPLEQKNHGENDSALDSLSVTDDELVPEFDDVEVETTPEEEEAACEFVPETTVLIDHRFRSESIPRGQLRRKSHLAPPYSESLATPQLSNVSSDVVAQREAPEPITQPLSAIEGGSISSIEIARVLHDESYSRALEAVRRTARRSNFAGQVEVEVHLDAKGRTLASRVVLKGLSLPGSLTNALSDAVRSFRYLPARKGGAAVASKLVVSFKIER